jgi:hypoxanthine-guanine phosphoribosyltransferase
MDYHRGLGKNLCVLGVLRGVFLFTTESTEDTEV